VLCNQFWLYLFGKTGQACASAGRPESPLKFQGVFDKNDLSSST
jgi:hypothetical protein